MPEMNGLTAARLLKRILPGVQLILFTAHGDLFKSDEATSAGISAGIDMALKVVSRYFGDAIARATAKHMEYPYPDSNARRIALA